MDENVVTSEPEVVYHPRQQLVIHECVQRKLNDMVNLSVIGAQAGSIAAPLLWVNGMVIRFSVLPWTDATVSDVIKNGTLHWDFVEFALMDSFKSTIEVKQGNIVIPVIDVSSTPTFKAVAKYLKTHHGKEV
ncbi:Uncharacterised protein [uncultured archaeon]|nr:Uncharacterised protein [uncultured archaeon]